MINTSYWTCHLVANKCTAIYSLFGLDCVDGGPSPSGDCRHHPHGCAHWGKGETGGPTNSVTSIGRVVIHVALAGISLTPNVFMWSDVLSLGVIARAGILSRIQVGHLTKNPMGFSRVCVPCMIRRS